MVEDEAAVRTVTRRTLTTLGHDVLEAEDGERALEIVRSERVDLVLTDIVMPDLSGRELVRRLREAGIETPVVYMSGYPGEEDPEEGVPFLQKPFSRTKLARIIDEVLT